MNIALQIIFIFYLGCTLGWVIELLYRRLAHGKWVNPGLLIGPYLPIYGFGLVIMSIIYSIFNGVNVSPFIIILFMGILMTLLELIGGLIGLMNNVRLWDYSSQWGNYKGLICPLFSLIWTAAGALYYFFLAQHIINALEWFSKNLTFSFALGLFTGCIIIDFIYSTKIYIKIRKFAKENDITVKYEQFKIHIKDAQAMRKEKYSFINPFKQTKTLKDYLSDYKKDKKNN